MHPKPSGLRMHPRPLDFKFKIIARAEGLYADIQKKAILSEPSVINNRIKD